MKEEELSVKDLIFGNGSDYDGQDQAYQDLLSENDELRFMIGSIAALIHYQAPLKEQDMWLAEMIKRGFYTVEEEE